MPARQMDTDEGSVLQVGNSKWAIGQYGYAIIPGFQVLVYRFVEVGYDL